MYLTPLLGASCGADVTTAARTHAESSLRDASPAPAPPHGAQTGALYLRARRQEVAPSAVVHDPLLSTPHGALPLQMDDANMPVADVLGGREHMMSMLVHPQVTTYGLVDSSYSKVSTVLSGLHNTHKLIGWMAPSGMQCEMPMTVGAGRGS